MSNQENAIASIIKTAIQREIDAYTLYNNAASMTSEAGAREVLEDLAAQEQGHRHRLEALLRGDAVKVVTKTQRRKVEDLKITDYLIEVPLTPDSDLQDILIVAGKRERASYELYNALARVAEDDETRQLFEYLADEELIHKRRVERLYDDLVYAQN